MIPYRKITGLIAAGKAILGLLGLPLGPCRPPVRTLSDEQTEALRRALDAVGFFDHAMRYD